MVKWGNGNARKRIISIKGKITTLRNNASNFDWSKLRSLKRELSKAYMMKKPFGNRSLEPYGCMKGIKIHHIFTWQPCKEFQTSDVRWVVDQIDIIQEVEQYYNSLFSTSNPTDLNCILNHITMIVSDSINQDLIKEVDDEEIKNVVFAMHPLKAPGIDGMTPLFFQTYWNIL